MLKRERKQLDSYPGTMTRERDMVGGLRRMSWKTIILIHFLLLCVSLASNSNQGLNIFRCQIIRFVHISER